MAARACKHGLLDEFSVDFLTFALGQMKPQTLWKSLLSMETSRERIRLAETQMCRSHFAEKILSGESEVRGWTIDMRPILWYRLPSTLKEYKVGTPKFEALLRYSVYIFELLAMSIGDDFGDAIIVVDDESSNPSTENNFEALREIFKTLRDAFPVPNAKIYILNAARSKSPLWKIAQTIFPREYTNRCCFLEDRELVARLVSSPSDIPPWWFNKSASDFQATYNNVWDYQRCMTRGNKPLTLNEVFCDKIWASERR